MTSLRAPLRSVWWHGFVTAAVTVGGLLLGIVLVCCYEACRSGV